MAEIITDSNIEETLNTDKLVVIDAHAKWCGPCKVIGPIIEKLHSENTDVIVGKVDVDENPETSTKYGIRNIPTILFIKNGNIVDKIVGMTTQAELQKRIDTNK